MESLRGAWTRWKASNVGSRLVLYAVQRAVHRIVTCAVGNGNGAELSVSLRARFPPRTRNMAWTYLVSGLCCAVLCCARTCWRSMALHNVGGLADARAQREVPSGRRGNTACMLTAASNPSILRSRRACTHFHHSPALHSCAAPRRLLRSQSGPQDAGQRWSAPTLPRRHQAVARRPTGHGPTRCHCCLGGIAGKVQRAAEQVYSFVSISLL